MFIPHGERCEADDSQLPEARCDEQARGWIEDRGRRRYVCASHLTWWVRDHPQGRTSRDHEPIGRSAR